METTSKPRPDKNELLFVTHTLSTATDRSTKAAVRAQVQQHAQQRRRRAEAYAQGKSTPNWTNFTATIQFPSVQHRDGVAELCHTYQPSDNCTDPFHSTAIGTDVGSHLGSVFTIFDDVVRQNFLGEACAPQDICVTRKTTRHSTIMHERLVQCVQNDTLMYATLSYALSFQSWGTNLATNMRDADFFHLKALQSLRSRLDQPDCQTDTWLLVSVYSLAITEGWRGMIAKRKASADPSAPVRGFVGSGQNGLDIHLGALAKLIEKSGGWKRVHPYVLESFILADKHASFAKNLPPMLRPWWDPGALPDKFKSQHKMLSGSPEQLMGSELLLQSCHSDMTATLRGCVDYLQLSRALWRSEGVSPELESWLALRLHALQYHLLWAYHESEMSLFDYCVSLAALAVLLICCYGRGMRAGAAWVSKQLCHLLRALKDQDEEEHWGSRTTTWFLFVGAMATLEGSEKDFCLQNLLTRGFKDISQIVGIESLLTAHLYLKERQEKQVRCTIRLIETFQVKQYYDGIA